MSVDLSNPPPAQSAPVPPAVDPTPALLALCAALLPVWGQHLATSCAQSEAAVQEMMAAFAQLGPPPQPSAQALAQVERLYAGFQYQDRISQMMTLLHDDMARLAAVLANPDASQEPLTPQAWLERLASQYVMQDQHHNDTAPAGGAPTDSADTTFF